MNYIKQLNGFHDRLLSTPLPSSTQCLYFALLHINNKCGWIREFTVANMTLQSMCSISRQELHKSRNILVQKGFIQYTRGKGTNAGAYRLISLYDSKVHTECDTTSDTKESTMPMTKQKTISVTENRTIPMTNAMSLEMTEEATIPIQSRGQSSCTLIKQNNTLNKTDAATPEEENAGARAKEFKSIVKMFNQNIHPITQLEADDLSSWLEEGMNPDLVERGIKEAVLNNARNMKYINAILFNWASKGIDTIEKLDAYLRDRQDEKSTKVQYNQNAGGIKNVGKTHGTDRAIKIDKSKFRFSGTATSGV